MFDFNEDHCEKLKLPLMVSDNSQGTAFTVSIEASSGVTTGISAADRAYTILRAVAGSKAGGSETTGSRVSADGQRWRVLSRLVIRRQVVI